VFSIPAVTALEFGTGKAFASMRGSQANDSFVPSRPEGGPVTATNNNGGLNGGITNGMPVAFTVTIKPTPSIALEQDTVDMRSGQAARIAISGRHDPCIVPRAVPVVEAAAALAVSELFGVWL
jgi:chorismate synthase